MECFVIKFTNFTRSDHYSIPQPSHHTKRICRGRGST